MLVAGNGRGWWQVVSHLLHSPGIIFNTSFHRFVTEWPDQLLFLKLRISHSTPEMKSFFIRTALSGILLSSSALARYGLSPDSIPLLTKTVDYTFHTICDEFHNPAPVPMFDEAVSLNLAVREFEIELTSNRNSPVS